MNFWKKPKNFRWRKQRKKKQQLKPQGESRRQRILLAVYIPFHSLFHSSLGRQSTCWQRWPLRAEGAVLKETEREIQSEREQVRACSEVLQRADKARQSGRGIKEAAAHTHTHTHFECVGCADDKFVAYFLGSISFAAHLGHTIPTAFSSFGMQLKSSGRWPSRDDAVIRLTSMKCTAERVSPALTLSLFLSPPVW